MNKTQLIDAIKQALQTRLHLPVMDYFHENARLNEDLYLDSVLVLQLLVSLENELNITIPDDAFDPKDFETVSTLADFLLGHEQPKPDTSSNSSQIDSDTEEFDDIKVHCFVSCLCEIIKADPSVDHRPFYFGVWDAEIFIDDNLSLNYHSDVVNHDFFKQWYETLYHVPIIPWYDHRSPKDENIDTLLGLIDRKTDTQQIMVMLDLFLLPERENKFNQNPFPHYVILEKTDNPNLWFMSDPDFRWEGTLEKGQIIDAIKSKSVAGGYHFDSKDIKPTQDIDIFNYFIACFVSDNNILTSSIRKVVDIHTGISHEQRLADHNQLESALKQLPVLAIRKYAYEHGLAFFWRSLKLDNDKFEDWCITIEKLVSTYKKIQYRAFKLAAIHKQDQRYSELLNDIYSLLQEQDETEYRIKEELFSVFKQWAEARHFDLSSITFNPKIEVQRILEAN